MSAPERVHAQVVYAHADRQVVLTVEVPVGATIEQAIRASGILTRCPDIDLASNAVGIFGARATLQSGVRAGDRIEIYRPLRVDPKEARRRRAARKTKKL